MAVSNAAMGLVMTAERVNRSLGEREWDSASAGSVARTGL